MVILTRTVRFAVNPPLPSVPRTVAKNGYAGQPPVIGLGRHYELDVSCRGVPDPRTGYLFDIKEVDRLVRDIAIPVITEVCNSSAPTSPAVVLAGLLDPLNAALGANLARIRWRLSPYHSLEMSTQAPATVLVRQKFDFAAAHRLHSPHLTDTQNRETFGKCNNPAGHGHNYQVEPCVAAPVDRTGPGFSVHTLQDLTNRVLIDRFDHKHLNVDTAEFSDTSGVTPTVENIARVFYDLLAPEISKADPRARLASITVWETDRTSCTYPA